MSKRSPEHECVIQTLRYLYKQWQFHKRHQKVKNACEAWRGAKIADLLAIKTLARNWRNRNKKGAESE